MRIRKHARVSAPPISPTSTSPSTDVWELNPSPWNVLSEHPQLEPEYQGVIVDDNGGGRESDYAPDSLVDLKKQSIEEVGKQRKKEVVKEDEERRLSLVGSVKEKGKKRVNKAKREVGYIQCSRSDGRKWHCKNMAKEGYTLCEHHLMKQKSYHSNHMTKCPPRKYVKKAKAALTTSPTEYYYYSGFGPWWGRNRGGNEIQRDELKVVDAANQATSSSSSRVHIEHHHDENDCMPDYFDFDDAECSKEEEEKKMGKKRGRPIKARSVIALL